MRIECSTGVANIADCVEQSCELEEAHYCSDITVALIVLNLIELKTFVLILWVSTRCAFIYTVIECLCIRLLYCLWFCKAQGSFRTIACVRHSFKGGSLRIRSCPSVASSRITVLPIDSASNYSDYYVVVVYR